MSNLLARQHGTVACDATGRNGEAVRPAHLPPRSALDARCRWAREVVRVLGCRGVSGRQAAARVGVAEAVFRRVLAGEAPLSLEKLSALGPAIELDVLEARVRQLRGQAPREGTPPERHVLRCSHALGRLALSTAEAIADDEVTAQEAAVIRCAVSATRQELDALEADL